MARGEPRRIAIIGAGPIGLEAGLLARQLGYGVTILEKGEIAESVQRWGHVRMFSPFGMNTTTLGLETIRNEHPQHPLPAATELLSGREYRDAYLLPLARTQALSEAVQTHTEVLHIGRAGLLVTDPPSDPRRALAPFRILIRKGKGTEEMLEADYVLDCSGTYGQHRWIGDGGIPALGERAAEKAIAYGLEDVLGDRQQFYAGKSILVVGAGYSAATTVCNLATLAEKHTATWVIWVTRGSRATPMLRNPADPLRERDRLAARANSLATRGEGNVEYHAQTVIDAIEQHAGDKGFRVMARCANRPMEWEIERIVANVGYLPDLRFCSELHVQIPPCGPTWRQAEPGYLVLGSKSMGADGRFLLRSGLDQLAAAMRSLGGKGVMPLTASN